MAEQSDPRRRVVITGIGMLASVGHDREAVWRAVRQGESGVRLMRGVKAIPDGLLVAAQVGVCPDRPGRHKPISLCLPAAAEAVADSGLDLAACDPYRIAAAISGHMGDTDFVVEQIGRADLIDPGKPPWWGQWYPCSACSFIANQYRLYGPRISHSTACSSGLIDILAAVRAIRDGRCDRALVGSAEAIHPLFAAGFHRMGVLAYDADDPTRACRPFDRNRSGFVMGEGAAMFVFERLDLARDRGAKIYAEILGGHVLASAYHLTGLDAESDALVELIRITLKHSNLPPEAIDYINAHGTGTRQNDVMEASSIRRAFGAATDRVCVSATKSMLGHLVNASGSVELAVTTLALRDGFVPPTRNLTDPDPQCRIDCIPNVGRPLDAEYAMKLSIAFGGHLAAIAIRRWPRAESGRESRDDRSVTGRKQDGAGDGPAGPC